MARSGRTRGRSPPWYGDERQRLIFELRARRFFPRLHGKNNPGGHEGWGYVFDLDVTGYETRRVVILFRESSRVPRVYSDGPTESPHRFPDDSLCMWHPNHPREQRWVFRDGLHELLAHVAEHLFKEAWWRETDMWLGPEEPHVSLERKEG